MQTITFSHTRQHLADTMTSVVQNHMPVTITRQNKEPVVMISLEDFRSMEETAYLMQSTANATRLNAAIEQIRQGKAIKRELIEV